MKKAFSLIELMVTIGIMTLIFVTALPSFQKYSYINELDRATDTITSAILETQTLALAPPTNKNRKHDCYEIRFFAGSYEIWSGIFSQNALDESINLVSSDKPVLVESGTLPNKVNISNLITANNHIDYSISNQARIIYPAYNISLTFKHDSYPDKTKNVSINFETSQVSANGK